MNTSTHEAARVRLDRRAAIALTIIFSAAAGACPEPPPTAPEGNARPTAQAGQDITVSVGIPVRLTGSGVDPEGSPLEYEWTLKAPPGSGSSLEGATTPNPTFTPDLKGEYRATLVVVDDAPSPSEPDVVVITAVDRTVRYTIGPDGGEASSWDGSLTLKIPSGALDDDEEIELTDVPPPQVSVLGDELASHAAQFEAFMAFAILVGGGDVELSLDATLEWEADVLAEGEAFVIQTPEMFFSDGGLAERIEQWASAALDDGPLYHTGLLRRGGYVALIPSGIQMSVSGLSDEAQVGATLTATVSAEWQGFGDPPSEVEIEAAADAPLTTDRPPFRVAWANGRFEAELEYVCDAPGTGSVRLGATNLRQAGAPSDQGYLRTDLEKGVTCVSGPGGEGLSDGYYPVHAVSDLMGAFKVRSTLPFEDAEEPVLLGSNEELFVWDLVRAQRLWGGELYGSPLPLSTVMAVTRPGAGPVGPAAPTSHAAPPMALLALGGDFNNSLDPMGGAIFDYDPATGTFADTPRRLPGAYWDAVPAGGEVTDEIVAATNFGVDFIQWDGTTWSHQPDQRLPLDRYGLPHLLRVSAAYAAEAFGPLLVSISPNVSGTPARLYYDERGANPPVDVGELGLSPAMIRCALPVCVVVLARGDAIRTVLWDGASQPTIVGDPIPVGTGPGVVALHRTTSGVTLAATFTGWEDDVVTLTELHDTASVLSSTSLDLRALGCRDPRSGDWVPNPESPDDPYLVVSCFTGGGYYLTRRSAFTS